MSRSAEITRHTSETEVELALGLDGAGAGSRETGVGFFDHLLDAVARHGRLDLDVRVRGDLETGAHHTVEDTGLALGRALDDALGDRAGIRRYGHAVIPMDEARATAPSTCSAATFRRPGGRVPGGAGGRLRHRPGRGVLPRGGLCRQADAAPARGGGRERPSHGRGVVQPS